MEMHQLRYFVAVAEEGSFSSIGPVPLIAASL